MSNPKNLTSSHRFKFTLTSERFRNNQLELMINGINIPGMQLGIVNHPTPIRQIERPGDSITFNDLSIEFLISENFTEWKEIYDWLYDLRDFNKMNFDNSIIADASLVILSSKLNPLVCFDFTNIYPYNLSDLNLTLSVSDSEPLICETTFKFQNYKFLSNI